ncbi:hypothetical protein ACVWWO_007504 [Bradyrhizobium sp. F1.13.1]
MDGGQEVSGKFVVASSNTPEILEPAETALDNIAPFIEALAEAVEGYPVGFVWNDGFRAAIDDFGAKADAIVAFVHNEGRHGRRELQKGRPCGNVCGLSRSEMKCARFAIRVAQRVDFRGPPTARAADRLFTLPPFPPLTLDAAVGVAEKHVNGRAVLAEYERQKDGRWVYDVEVKTDTTVSDVQIDPDKGTVIASKVDQADDDDDGDKAD